MEGLRERYLDSATLIGDNYELTEAQISLLKQTLIGILQDILSVCEKYDIQVTLAGGTALGAVRHKGFIPWDDDLDLFMPREDYKRFQSVFEKELGQKYDLAAPNQNGLYKTRFPKIFKKNTVYRTLTDVDSNLPCGIFADIFVVEYVPDNRVLRLVKGLWCNLLMLCGSRAYMYEHDNEVLRLHLSATKDNKKAHDRIMLAGKVLSVVPSKKWFDWIDKSVQYNKKTKLSTAPTGRKHYFGEMLNTEDFFPAVYGEFEGVKVPLPANYDKYLTHLYGDYHKIPPVEKREKHYIVELKFDD